MSAREPPYRHCIRPDFLDRPAYRRLEHVEPLVHVDRFPRPGIRLALLRPGSESLSDFHGRQQMPESHPPSAAGETSTVESRDRLDALVSFIVATAMERPSPYRALTRTAG